MDFNFETVNKSNLGGVQIPSNMLHVGKQTIALPASVIAKCQETRHSLSGKGESSRAAERTESVLLNLDYDKFNRAIRISESPNGFSAIVSNRTGTASMLFPAQMRRMGAERGWYQLVEGSENIFTWKGEANV